MNIINTYNRLKGSYKNYISSFITIKDPRIKKKVTDAITNEEMWPDALIQFNPNFELCFSSHDFISISRKQLNLAVKARNLS